MKYSKFIASAFIVLAACGEKKSATEAEAAKADSTVELVSDLVHLTDAQIRNAGIVTDTLSRKVIASVLQVNGKVDVPPQNLVSINMPLGGYIRDARLMPGMHVRKGQVLATLEDQRYIEMQQEFLNAKTDLLLAEREYKRQQTLRAGNAASEKVFQQAEAEYNSQQVQVRALGEKLRLIGINPDRLTASSISRSVNLHAPINGYVSKVLVNPGKYVTPSDVLFELVNPTDIHLALTVFEKDLSRIFIGQKVVATTVSEPGKKHYAKIILISRDLGEDRSAVVHCHFDDYDETLVPGTFMNAMVETRSREGLTLPQEAIVRFENKQYVFVQAGAGTYQMQEVTTGNTENGFTELRGDASQYAGKKFVVKGAYSLLMKMKNTEE